VTTQPDNALAAVSAAAGVVARKDDRLLETDANTPSTFGGCMRHHFGVKVD
jgi:hypothetical protein